ncbi:Nucleolar protein 12 [Colletotrichum gloeosporioides]|uniref:Nucleolar protein 12 n=1 Tax=Colletotrichum gloeosporioides TaxID=474922 RepID=A0A8H4CYZ0_COLGL|nr:Nucleolar protein 12 [Colletotrichum gloeosporioides]KAF3812221.1 Nucleolar protein 12 [Colletotrichum gloeosporioides]
MAKGNSKITASTKAIDPTLDALFASSAGPVKAPSTTRFSQAPPPKSKPETADSDEELPDADEEDDEELSELEQDSEEGSDNDAEAGAESEEEEASETNAKPKKERKRKRDEDDIEGKYLSKLAQAEEKETPAEKRSKKEDKDEGAASEEEEESDSEVPVHESLAAEGKNKDKNDEIDKANRTVFLSNVASEAVSNKAAKRTLEAHLTSVLDKDATPAQKIESIRFRSVAFSGGALPKRAAYITKAVMQETTKSANAYVVFSTPAAARKVVSELNGTVVLERHLRVDSVAHPSPTDHRRCVFVGNLGFVDDETITTVDEAGETVQKKRTKVPADIEEGLWRTFGKQAGKVENVRVIRDPKTRVGKGFAYVQFYDANHVEAALLLDGKKYPPMLPRIMRVARAKAPHKTALAMERSSKARVQAARGAPGSTSYKAKITPEQQSMAGRASRLLGRAGAMREQRKGSDRKPPRASGSGAVPKDDIKAPEAFIFEGRRASAKDGRPKDLKFGNKRAKVKGRVQKSKPTGRGAKRAEAWKNKEKK